MNQNVHPRSMGPQGLSNGSKPTWKNSKGPLGAFSNIWCRFVSIGKALSPGPKGIERCMK